MQVKTLNLVPKSTYAAPALEKGLEVLELMASSRRPFTQTEIARALDRTPGELYRMLAVLEQRGYLVKDEMGGYSLTLKLFTLGQEYGWMGILLKTARGFMRDFSWQSGQECHLSVLEDGRLTVIAQEPGSGGISLQVKAGSQHNPLRTVSGRLLLALASEDERAWHVRRAAEAFAEKRAGAPRLAAALNQIAQDGFAEAEGESLPGVLDTAFPVGAGKTGGLAALACSRFALAQSGKAGKQTRELLRQTADRITRALID
jgi:DNA-binding IclR family transcriptional regulator